MSHNSQFAKYCPHVTFPTPEVGKLKIYFPYFLEAWALAAETNKILGCLSLLLQAQLWRHLAFLQLLLQKFPCLDTSLVSMVSPGIGRGASKLLRWSIADFHWSYNWQW